MIELIIAGGPVMIPILLCSVLAVAVSLERLWVLMRSRVDTEELMEDIKLALGQGKVLEAMQIAKKSRGPVAAVLAAGIAYYDRSREEIKERMENVGMGEIHKMERRMNILGLIVTVAPLLGLLGTVTGIMDAFNVFAGLAGAYQGASSLAPGIAEALVTTAAGLVVAIPTMVIHSYLNNLIDRNVAEMNRRSDELLTVLGTRGEY